MSETGQGIVRNGQEDTLIPNSECANAWGMQLVTFIYSDGPSSSSDSEVSSSEVPEEESDDSISCSASMIRLKSRALCKASMIICCRSVVEGIEIAELMISGSESQRGNFVKLKLRCAEIQCKVRVAELKSNLGSISVLTVIQNKSKFITKYGPN